MVAFVELPVVGGPRDGRHELVEPTWIVVTFIDPNDEPIPITERPTTSPITRNRSIYYLDRLLGPEGRELRFLCHSGVRREDALAALAQRFPLVFAIPGRITE